MLDPPRAALAAQARRRGPASLPAVPPQAAAPLADEPLLQSRDAAVKDNDRSYAVVQQLGDAPQRADDVRIFDRSALLVAHRLDELRHPDGNVDGERRVLERLDMDATAARF